MTCSLLRERAIELGYEPGTLPFAFDGAMWVLVEKVFEEFVSEAGKETTPVQPLVNERLLHAIRTHNEALYRRVFADEAEPPPAQSPPRPLVFEGRDHELSELKARLLGGGETGKRISGHTVILTGIPGVGKTALAAVVANDSDLRKCFPDGTPWVSLGPSPDIIAELGALARRLGAASDLQLRNLAEAQEALSSLLADKRVLLVVDDAYGAADVAAFRVVGEGSAILMTTRDREVARQWAPGPPGPLVLEQLSEEGSLKLLGQLTPEVVELYPIKAEALVRELGACRLLFALPAACSLRRHIWGGASETGEGTRGI